MATPRRDAKAAPWGQRPLNDMPIADVVIYSPTSTPTFEHCWLTTTSPTTLCWSGEGVPERVGGRAEASALREFVMLHRGQPADIGSSALRLAKAHGPLGLCAAHRLPRRHLSELQLREVQRLLDEAQGPSEEDGPWWSLSPCDQMQSDLRRWATIEGERRHADVTEMVDDWVRWSRILYGVVAVSWRLQRGRPGDLDVWRHLTPLLPLDADRLMKWTPNELEGVVAPPTPGTPLFNFGGKDGPQVGDAVVSVDVDGRKVPYYLDRPLAQQSEAGRRWWNTRGRSMLLADQQSGLRKVLDVLTDWSGLRIRVEWTDGRPTRLASGGDTFLGSLMTQLTLGLGGVTAFAICDYCRDAFVPVHWPRSGPDGLVFCATHQNDKAAQARLRRRLRDRTTSDGTR